MADSTKSRAVVLLSGGMDSAVCAALAVRDYGAAAAVHISYGQRTEERERQSFLAICRRLNILDQLIVRNDALSAIGGSALTDEGIAVPHSDAAGPGLPGHGTPGGGVPVTYVPFRNAHFLSAAVSWAEVLGATDLVMGVNAVDYSGYPDCRPEFIEAFEKLANLATKAGVEGRQTLKIHTPLIALTKAEIIRKGIELDVDYELTSSCYDPSPAGEPCGECDSCLLRQKGFRENGIEDPLSYRRAADEARG